MFASRPDQKLGMMKLELDVMLKAYRCPIGREKNKLVIDVRKLTPTEKLNLHQIFKAFFDYYKNGNYQPWPVKNLKITLGAATS